MEYVSWDDIKYMKKQLDDIYQQIGQFYESG